MIFLVQLGNFIVVPLDFSIFDTRDKLGNKILLYTYD